LPGTSTVNVTAPIVNTGTTADAVIGLNQSALSLGASTITSGTLDYARLPAGSVIQVQTVRSDSRTTKSAGTSGGGTTLPELNLTITPRFSNSILICQWMINYESNYNLGVVIHKNGSIITTSGETGYNASSTNRWSTYVTAAYDPDDASTPSNMFVQYRTVAGATSSMTFAPAVRSTSSSAYTFALNRSLSNPNADAYEYMVSTGTIWEIRA
jgi:hypothetical protein